MQNLEPYVSIIIPAFNSGLTLGHTIEACLKQGYPEDKLEVIVVDDGSGDDTKAVVERFGVRYIYQEKAGPASARNNGWRNSKGDAICFTDADCIPEPDWVSKLVRHYGMNDIGAVAGSYSVHGSPYLLDKFIHYEIRDRHSRMPEYISSFGTYNVMIKKAILELTEGFNPEYYSASGEDTDLSYKIVKAGYKIYFERDALVSHKNILRLWKYLFVQFRHGYWRMKLYRENIPMITKDEYGYWKDFLEVLLILILTASLFFDFQYEGILIAALFIIQIPVAVKIVFEGKNILYIFFSFITFIRAFVRVIGGMLGFVKFWVFRMG
ncbi:MAG: glycosyltransferase [Candidatus Omnitrophica bacterium]|nr:glycosyltransferase [Candidatus Omnitrophota bacterium]